MLDSLSRSFEPMANAARDYSRQRQMGIGDLLLENRIVFLDGPIHDASANVIVMKLLYLQSENKHQDVHFYINSPGGSPVQSALIAKRIRLLRQRLLQAAAHEFA